MKRLMPFVLMFALGCSLFKPNIPSDLKTKLNKLLADGSVLNAMTEQGVTYSDYSQQLAQTKADYDLARATWPSDLLPEAQQAFDRAFEGWALVHYLWDAKIRDLDTPTEPDINKYAEIVSYAGEDMLTIQKRDANYIVPAYRGKKYLPFDDTIGILMSLASNHFHDAQAMILKAID